MSNANGLLAAAGLATLALLSACSSSTGGATSQPARAGGGTTTVAVHTESGSTVLVDAGGRTLYLSDQERAAGKVLCSSAGCTAIWVPLMVGKGQRPTGPSGVSGQLGTVRRPDGSTQVTFRSSPLYTFALDHGAGELNGNGAKDSFDGTDFVWHAAAATGSAPVTAGGGSSGGYRY